MSLIAPTSNQDTSKSDRDMVGSGRDMVVNGSEEVTINNDSLDSTEHHGVDVEEDERCVAFVEEAFLDVMKADQLLEETGVDVNSNPDVRNSEPDIAGATSTNRTVLIEDTLEQSLPTVDTSPKEEEREVLLGVSDAGSGDQREEGPSPNPFHNSPIPDLPPTHEDDAQQCLIEVVDKVVNSEVRDFGDVSSNVEENSDQVLELGPEGEKSEPIEKVNSSDNIPRTDSETPEQVNSDSPEQVNNSPPEQTSSAPHDEASSQPLVEVRVEAPEQSSVESSDNKSVEFSENKPVESPKEKEIPQSSSRPASVISQDSASSDTLINASTETSDGGKSPSRSNSQGRCGKLRGS